MNCIKIVTISSLFIIPAFLALSKSEKGDGAFEPAVRQFTTGFDVALKNNMPELHNVGADLGRNFALGTITAIGAGLAKAGVGIKTGVAIATVCAPYVLVGATVAGVGFGGYKIYRLYNPTPQQIVLAVNSEIEVINAQNDLKKKQNEQLKIIKEQQLNDCLVRHQRSERNCSGIPVPCEHEACSCAVFSGAEHVEKTLNSFNKYAPKVSIGRNA